MRRLLKGILLLVLTSALIGSPVFAWIVYQNGIANVSFTIARPATSWELMEIEFGSINAGAIIESSQNTNLTIANAEALNMSFAVIGLTEEETQALQSLIISIGEDSTGDAEIDIPWSTIVVLPTPLPGPSVQLGEGVYNVVIVVEGVVGYPEADTPVSFTVEGTCDATPITLP